MGDVTNLNGFRAKKLQKDIEEGFRSFAEAAPLEVLHKLSLDFHSAYMRRKLSSISLGNLISSASDYGLTSEIHRQMVLAAIQRCSEVQSND